MDVEYDQKMYNYLAIRSLPQQGSMGTYTAANGIIFLDGKPVGMHGFANSFHAYELFH